MTLAKVGCIIIGGNKVLYQEVRAIKVYEYGAGKIPKGKRVIALGFFDGVHLGHREILKRAVSEAKALGIPSAVFTFLSESVGLKGEKRIYSTKEKLSLISECGIDEAIVADFSSVKSVSAEDFIEKVLVGALGCAIALSGADFRFGKGALGDTSLLSTLLESHGASLICPDYVMADGEKISSTRIKNLILLGRVKEAAELLGSPYSVTSEVQRGLGLGKTFGFPTVNTEIAPGAVSLRNGVYSCRVLTGEKNYKAIANVGTCPTVGEREKHIETFILDFDGNLYGEEILISFLDFIREEKKFDSIEQLKMQINIDITAAFGNKE